MNEKTPNYTDEQTAAMVDAYTAVDSDADRRGVVEDQAAILGKSTRSIIAKLSREGVYVKPERTGTNGEPRVTKATLVGEIAAACGATQDQFDSLEKANANVLRALLRNVGEPS